MTATVRPPAAPRERVGPFGDRDPHLVPAAGADAPGADAVGALAPGPSMRAGAPLDTVAGVFGSVREVCDPTLGVLRRRGRWWQGEITLSPDLFDPSPTASLTVPLRLPGPRRGPDGSALALARRAPAELAACRSDIAAALDEHRRAYAVPPLRTAAVPIGLAVISFEHRPALELAYRVPWDDEHTLGARVCDGVLVELCGSI